MQVVFLGTPQFAVYTLQALSAAHHDIVAVYTQPDRPRGRGQELALSPVKDAALRLRLPVYQPERIRRPEVISGLAAMKADVMVVVGYGQIIPQAIIDLPRLGIVNVHASLLPRWRGAAPIQWAVASGDTVTGVTTMTINAGLDTGDILLKAETPIAPDETALDLSLRLATMGASLLVETLARLEAGDCPRQPQNDADATLARILKKEDGLIDWRRPAHEIVNLCRGFLPWPGAWTTFRGQRLSIHRCRVAFHDPIAPGTLRHAGKRLFAGTGDGVLELQDLQMEGRNRVPAAAFLNGMRVTDQDVLGAAS